MGLTHLNDGKTEKAVKHLREGLSCKHTRVQAAEALQQIFAALQQQDPTNAHVLKEWGDFLTEAGFADAAKQRYDMVKKIQMQQTDELRMKRAVEESHEEDQDSDRNAKNYVSASHRRLHSAKLQNNDVCMEKFQLFNKRGKKQPPKDDVVKGAHLDLYLHYARSCSAAMMPALEGAAGLLVPLLQAQPDNSTLHVIWGWITKRTQGGEDAARRYVHAGRLYLQQKAHEEAFDAFTEATVVAPKDCTVWIWQAQAALMVNQLRIGRAALKKTIKVSKGNKECKDASAMAKQALKDHYWDDE